MSKKSLFSKLKGTKKDDDQNEKDKEAKTADDVFDQIEQDKDNGTVAVNSDPYDEDVDEEYEETDEEEQWLESEGGEEGQLSIDVYQTKDNIVIKSTIAGVSPEDIDVNINNDMVTIKGSRHQEEEISEDDYFYQECYWGVFSRSVVLPQEVQAENAQASMKNGVLTLVLPKAAPKKPVEIKVKEN